MSICKIGSLLSNDFFRKGLMLTAATALLAANAGCKILSAVNSSDEPILRVGIMSDTQSYPGKTTDPGQIAMKRAMEQLKEKHIDVMIVNGDIADNANKKVYIEYREIVKEVFGDNPPIQLPIMGNHDYWNGMSTADAQKNYMDGMGVDAINMHKVIGGYDFVAVSPDCGEATMGSYHKESAEFLKKEVAAAFARDPNKPIFVVTHQHAADTVYGSHSGWGTPEITDILNKYENVLLFSGHSHFPLEDERSINQKNFSAVGTASLNYCEMEGGRVNGSIPPHANECKQYLYMEVFKDRLEIRRMAVATGCEIKPEKRWVLPLPLKKCNFVYTDKRAESRTAPEFPEGASATVEIENENSFENVIVTFDAACHDDFVHTYQITVFKKNADGTWKETGKYAFFSDFYRGLENMENPCSVTLSADCFNMDSEYRLEILPIESFGKIGKTPICVEFKTPAE